MTQQDSQKIFYLVGVATVGLLLLCSAIFFKERMLFVDPAFITFEIIQQDWFVFSEHRYGAFITQIFPLVASQLGLPLSVVLLVYSMSFYLFFGAVLLSCGHYLKQYRLSTLFCCYLTFFVSDVYFWPNNEVHQAVAYMIGFLGLFSYARGQVWQVPIVVHGAMAALIWLATLSHLLVAVPLGFLWTYLFLDQLPQTRKTWKFLITYSLLIVGYVGLRYWMSKESWYDGSKLDGVQTASFTKVVSAITNDQSLSFLRLLITQYWIAALLCIIGLIKLLKDGSFLKFGLTIGSICVYYLLVVLTHSAEITAQNLFYFESQWMCLSVIMATPFVFEVVPSIKTKQVVLWLGVAIFLLQLPKMYTSLQKFQTRLDKLHTVVAKCQARSINKGIINDSPQLEEDFLMTWGLPIESLLLSTMESGQTVTTKPLNTEIKHTTAKDSIYTCFDFIPLSELDDRYFELSDEEGYRRFD